MTECDVDVSLDLGHAQKRKEVKNRLKMPKGKS